MKIYNTLSRSLEEFKPIDKGTIRFYHCGPTVYWVQHIGNMRAMVWADFIRRSLIYLGYKVVFVRNYTDVGHLTSDEDTGEDKMEKGAKREGLAPDEIANKYIKIFDNDIASLNILPPTHNPRATDYVDQMKEMIGILIEKKYAYITDYAIYFDVSTFPKYNALNKQKMELNKKGFGKGIIEDPQKKHFADFALWFFKKGAHTSALQTWSSPWGIGFPGWHLECSAMAKHLLGDTIDIHMGGVEHISVHHTNEIAQSESANEVPFCHYWIHNEHLNVDNGKMAKSQGTSFTLQDIINKGFDPLDLRYFFMSAHYRSKQNFTWEGLEAAHSARLRLINVVKKLISQDNNKVKIESVQAQGYKKRFTDMLAQDFQISSALALIWDIVRDNNAQFETEKLSLLLEFDTVFGLKFNEIKEDVIPQKIIDFANQRIKAKQQKDFIKADKLRIEIEQKGYLIEDKVNDYKIKKM